MSSTRLLVLGVVRIFQPVHGYFVRRELLSWQAEQWAHLNPGSIYNALRTLTRDGFLDDVGTETHGGRPARTSYRLTPDGETELMTLERQALWSVDPFAPDSLLAAWSFSWVFSRDEVIAGFEHRLAQIAASGRAAQFAIEDLRHNTNTPPHVAEHLRLNQSHLDGEAGWTRELLERLRHGEYWFAGEPNPPWNGTNESALEAAKPSEHQGASDPRPDRSHAKRSVTTTGDR